MSSYFLAVNNVYSYDTSSLQKRPDSYGSRVESGATGSGVEKYGMPPKEKSLTFVIENSLFKDSYYAGRTSTIETITIVSKRNQKEKEEADIRNYLINRGLDGQQLDAATLLFMRTDNAIVNWIRNIDTMELPESDKLRLIGAADALRLKQIKLEARLHQLTSFEGDPSSYGDYHGYRKTEIDNALNEFRDYLNTITRP